MVAAVFIYEISITQLQSILHRNIFAAHTFCTVSNPIPKTGSYGIYGEGVFP
jgi:hypothetical protein